MIQLTLTLKMTTAQVVETSVTVNNNSPIQDYVHPDDQTQPTFKSIPASDKSHRSFLNGGFINSFFLQSASEQEVTEICSSFRSGTAPGYDSISMNVVKESFNLICAPLTYIINLSLNSGFVPQEMKIARVILLFKSGDYRPVSVLPVFSKFLERIVYNRLT